MKENTKDQKNGFNKGAVIDAVLDSGVLGSSHHQIQLFQYLINAKHEGTIHRVKAYNIAVDAFDRPQDFDGSSDSIVRVEMFRLRANLITFNNQSHRYRLDLPKATYKITIHELETDAEPLVSASASGFKNILRTNWLRLSLTALPIIAISGLIISELTDQSNAISPCSQILPNLSIHNVGSPSDSQIYVEKIIRSTAAQQTSFNVIAADQSCGKNTAPLFAINYALVHQEGRQINLAITVNSNDTGKIINSHHITGSSADIKDDIDLYHDIVKTANSISMPDSVLAKHALIELWPNERSLENYRCISMMYDSFSGGTKDEKKDVKECLERSLDTHDVPLDNLGALALIYLEIARNGDLAERRILFEAAGSLIDGNNRLWLESSDYTIAKLYYEAQRPDFNGERLESLLSDAESKYNTNPQVLIMVSIFYGYSLGRWEKAKSISDRTKLLYSITDQSTFQVDAGYAITKLDGVNLMDECAKFYAEGSVYIAVIVNACARKASDPIWFEISENNLSALNASSVEQRMAVFKAIKYDPHFIRTMTNLLTLDAKL